MGTNLFFETISGASPQTNPFIKRGPVQYENSFTGMKTITFKTMKVPPRKVKLPQDVNKIEFNLDWDYPTLLQKISEGSIKLQDILKKGKQNEENEEEEVEESERMEVVSEPVEEEEVIEADVEQKEEEEDTVPTELLEDYQKLQDLAFRPVKRRVVLDKIENCDSVFKEEYEYKNLEKQVLQPCGLFATEPVVDINEKTLSNCVNIDRCILYGIIEKSTKKPRILTTDEKRKVLTLENFDNLSLAGRYYVLKTHVGDLEDYLSTKSDSELNTRDKYGRTPLKTLEIYKKLTEAVKNRIEEIKFGLHENIV
ncbi:uncharacterized protein LOC130448297 [Diorhabda sublineata]|uniref:uncharacterized protein LOC130448297 n=1 Tax=Diorhabda sublineata TaxID=1163346 RepID=UPI0024E13A2E|nr:uncharacterized protein LOC130448297 [Diorhabda sublineata]